MKQFTLSALFTLAVFVALAQSNARPSASRFWLSKVSSFAVKPYDIFVYTVTNNGEAYDFIVTVKSFNKEAVLDYRIPQKNLKGSVILDSLTMQQGARYHSIFTDLSAGKQPPNFWLNKSSFRNLANGQPAKLDFGNGEQAYKRAATATQKIPFKGQVKLMTMYKIRPVDTAQPQEIWVLNDINNPLIIKLTGTTSISLKEVR